MADAQAVLEIGTNHRGGSVLLYAGEITAELKANSIESGTLKDAHSEVLPAYFKQRPIRAEKNLVIAESEQLSRLFEAVHQVLSTSDFQCIEINRAGNDTGHAYALFANGTQFNVFQNFSAVRVTRLENLSPAIKKYF